MKMIIGGAYQGQLAWAQAHFPEIADEDWIDGKECKETDIFTCKAIYGFHEYIRNCLKNGQDCVMLGEELIRRNPSLVVVTNELGYGVVPIEAFDREYRERTGRVCTVLAAASDEVYRVVCGVGVRIK